MGPTLRYTFVLLCTIVIQPYFDQAFGQVGKRYIKFNKHISEHLIHDTICYKISADTIRCDIYPVISDSVTTWILYKLKGGKCLYFLPDTNKPKVFKATREKKEFKIEESPVIPLYSP